MGLEDSSGIRSSEVKTSSGRADTVPIRAAVGIAMTPPTMIKLTAVKSCSWRAGKETRTQWRMET
ncbi:MAG: hypothetical protein A2270_10270 [Elusimicrobia bacterium RIFOXYA12_FULL_51_18]|nr:MAG: hypothetical protein A2270_10270 [Elusimicrobia bacterium RIFOXYA12_FULL_51_18]OGS29550.1 MAG: hypothetical protein A2218_00920 [Elusimicrobia bacterium RIFOXYA2_FULL_53_38]